VNEESLTLKISGPKILAEKVGNYLANECDYSAKGVLCRAQARDKTPLPNAPASRTSGSIIERGEGVGAAFKATESETTAAPLVKLTRNALPTKLPVTAGVQSGFELKAQLPALIVMISPGTTDGLPPDGVGSR